MNEVGLDELAYVMGRQGRPSSLSLRPCFLNGDPGKALVLVSAPLELHFRFPPCDTQPAAIR